MISRMIYVQVTYRIRNNRIAEAGREIAGFVDAIQKGHRDVGDNRVRS